MCLFAVFAAVVGLWRCGAPKAGSPCRFAAYVCDEESPHALECRDGTWTELPCRGPSGCTVVDGRVSCDMNGNLAGDLCALSAHGSGLCTADGLGTLECRQGSLVQTQTCASCTQSSTDVVCNNP